MARLARPRRGRASERRARHDLLTAAATAADLVLLLDADGRVETAWPEKNLVAGFPSERLRGRTLAEVGFPEAITAPIDAALAAFRAGQRAPRFANGMHPTTGRPFETRMMPRWHGSTFAGATLVRRDSFLLAGSEGPSVSETLQRYQKVYEHTQDAVFLVDVLRGGADFRYITTNPAHITSTGLTPEMIWGKRPRDILPPDVAEQVAANYRRCVAAGHPVQYEEWLTLPSGTRHWLTQLVPITNASGRVDLIAGMARDITDLREAQTQAFEALRRFENLHDSNDDSIFWVEVLPDGGFRYSYSNLSHQTKTGLRPDQFWGARPHEILPPAVADRVCANYQRALDAGVPVTYEEHPYFPAGNQMWLTQLVPIPNAAGRVDLIVGLARDITAIRDAEAARAAERARLDDVLASLDDVAFSVSADLRTLHYASPNAERLIGLDPHALLATPSLLRTVLSPEDEVRLLFKIQGLMRSGAIDTYVRVRSETGDWRHLRARARLVRGADGAPLRIDGVVSDHTAQRHTEEDAQRMRRQLDLVVDALDAAVWSIAPHKRRFSYMSRAIEPLLGVAADQVTLGTWLNAVVPDDRPPFMLAMRQLWQTGSVAMDFRVATPGGEIRWLHARGRTVADADGRTLRADGLVQDVTAQRRTEAALADARDAAEAATTAKSAFLAVMSHEIRTPLNGVLGLADLLLTTRLDDEQREFAETIVHSGRHLLVLLNDLLDISKIEAGGLDIEATPFAVEGLLRDTLRLHAPEARVKGLALTLHTAGPLPDTLVGDPMRLRQILSNLLSNAIKFTASGRVDLRVRVRMPNEAALPGRMVHALLSATVEDTGEGIPAGVLGHIFKPFTQADSTTTRRHGGTGLGLAISKRLAVAMGGVLGATSTPGVGSRFTLTLPLAVDADAREHGRTVHGGTVNGGAVQGQAAVARLLLEHPATGDGGGRAEEVDVAHGSGRTRHPAEALQEASAPAAAAVPAGLRVLIVDGSSIHRAVVGRMLERLGATVEAACDAATACTRVDDATREGTPFDAVLVDVHLPDPIGTDALRCLRTTHGGVPPYIVALAGSADDREALLGIGADAVLVKPVRPEALAAVLLGCVAAP